MEKAHIFMRAGATLQWLGCFSTCLPIHGQIFSSQFINAQGLPTTQRTLMQMKSRESTDISKEQKTRDSNSPQKSIWSWIAMSMRISLDSGIMSLTMTQCASNPAQDMSLPLEDALSFGCQSCRRKSHSAPWRQSISLCLLL